MLWVRCVSFKQQMYFRLHGTRTFMWEHKREKEGESEREREKEGETVKESKSKR